MKYEEFLKRKVISNKIFSNGFSDVKLNSKLFDWQKVVVKQGLNKERFAFFEDCGLGKTFEQLEWSNQIVKKTKGNVLIVSPLSVTTQTQNEGKKFGIDVNICKKSEDVKPGINITNYEMLDNFNAEDFIGVVLDESSILKSYTGTTKTKIINKFANTKYKLSCTATPAPNDYMELLNQAEFLGIMKSSEALSIWFINDTKNSGTYRLKGHAIKSFWEWVSSWSVYITNPSDIGFDGSDYILPKLNENIIEVKINELADDFTENGFFRQVDTTATGFHKEKRFTAKDRAKATAEIVNNSNEQFLIWCYTNYEADLLKKYIDENVEVRGSDKSDFKEKCAIDFQNGKIKNLISKPNMFGYGLNFQNCHNTIFCGLDYSYESYYQALRRIYRFGQTNEVNSYIVIGSTEKQILDTIKRKSEQQDEMIRQIKNSLRDIQTKNINGHEFKLNLEPQKILIPNWIRSEVG